MAAKPTIITWLDCGTKNRVQPRAQGISRRSVCHAALPSWIVETDAGGFDLEIVASAPCSSTSGRPGAARAGWSRRSSN
ncbi:MAG: hypothetical protein QOH83_299, partial [Solirubrobacteraceae bacterium]|nr:hypothetical protein [Solirubrobacteraceae bacterium]